MLTSHQGISLAALVGAALASVMGCSLILDTDKLQKGAGQAAAGAGGSLPDGEAPDTTIDAEPGQDADAEAEAAVTCTSDLDCYAKSDGDLCFLHPCDKSTGTCKAPEPWSGPVLVETSSKPLEIASNRDAIGVPALLADGESVFVAAWVQSGTATDVVLQKYYPNGQAAKKETFLNFFKDYFRDPAATAGMMLETTPKRLALLVPAATISTTSSKCIRRFWVGADLEQPTDIPSLCYDPVVAGGDYTADPRRTAPRLLRTSAATDLGVWIQDGELITKGTVGQKVTSLGGTVKNFAPLRAVEPLHAAILEAGNTPGEEDTMLWYSGKSPSSLFGAGPGPRLGISTAWVQQPVGSNVGTWSHPVAGAQTVEYFNVSCDNAACQSVAAQTPVEQAGTLMHSPSMAMRQSVSPAYVDLAIDLVFSGTNQGTTESSMLLQILRMQGQTVTYINPGAVFVSSAQAAGEVPIEELPYVLGRSAVLITDGGAMYVVWVQKVSGKEAMFMRTFQVKDTCQG